MIYIVRIKIFSYEVCTTVPLIANIVSCLAILITHSVPLHNQKKISSCVLGWSKADKSTCYRIKINNLNQLFHDCHLLPQMGPEMAIDTVFCNMSQICCLGRGIHLLP